MRDLKILFLEDLKSDFELAHTELQRNGFEFEWVKTETKDDFVNAISEFNPNLIISDYMLPQFTGMEALSIVKELPEKIPFIILTGSMNEETAVQCLKAGADDYVIKEFIGKLPYAVKEVLLQKEMHEEKVNAEKALVSSEKAYRHLFESNPQPMWVMADESLHFLAVNETAIQKYGYSRDEFLTMNIFDILPEDDIENFMQFLEINPHNQRSSIDTRHRCKDGSIRLVEAYSNLIDFEGQEARLVLINDVTEKIQMERELHQSEENFRHSLDLSPLGIRIVNQAGRTIYVNHAFLRIYEFSSLKEFVATRSRDRYTEESYQEHLERKSIRKAGGEVPEYEISIRRKNGEVRHVEVKRKEVIWNRQKHFQVINQDVTEQRNAEDALRKLSLAVEQSPDAIYITDTAANIEYVNPKGVELTGYSIDELIGQNPRIFSSGEKPEEEYSQLWETIKSGNIWKGEFHNQKKSGERYWESAIISPIVSKKGEITHFLAIKEDVTADKMMIQDLVIAKERAEESDKLKSAFLATMSHELRTPLNAVIGFSGLIDEDMAIEEITSFTKIIHNSGLGLLDIVESVLELTLLESKEAKVKATQFSLSSLMADVLETAQSEQLKYNSHQVEIECLSCTDAENAELFSDKDKLNKVMVQLLKNALKFTTSGKIEFGYVPEQHGNADLIKFFVKDTGIGISESQASFIFDRFRQAEDSYTRKYGGAGIGLTISKQIVELLGGRIWVESEPGKGSAFYFTIPYSSKKHAAKIIPDQSVPVRLPVSQATCTVLIAEDEESNYIFLRVLLRSLNIEVLHARDGHEAIILCSAHPEIDLVLMDINMPRMNGLEATIAIKQTRPNLPVIAITAFAMPDDRDKFLAEGCDGYLEKPVKNDKLIAILQNYFQIPD
jgi:PAS domain S-box-containing protein